MASTGIPTLDASPDDRAGDPGRERAPEGVDGTRAIRVGGALLLAAGAAILMGIITAEALFPVPYSTSHDTISNLGSTWHPGGVVRQPSAVIFNTTMLVTGAMIAVAAAFLHRASGRRGLSGALGVLGLGVLLVGVFHGENVGGEPSATGVPPLVSMVAFVAGAVAALLAFRALRGPFRYVSAVSGVVVVLGLVLQGPLGGTRLGQGGLERWVAYPTVLWLVAFGGYLLAARPDDLRPAAHSRRDDRAVRQPPRPTAER